MEQVRVVRRRRWADAGTPPPGGQWSMADRWPLLVSVLADEQADLLQAVQEHVARPDGGRLSPQAAQALLQASERLRRASRRAQQITRLASGRVRQFRERIELRQVVLAVLTDLGLGTPGGGVIADLDLAPGEACMDPSAAYTVVESLLSWLRVHGGGLVLKTEAGRGAAGPFLSAFGPRAQPRATGGVGPPRRRLDDGLELLLLQQAVWASGLTLRVLAGADISARIGFPPPSTGAGVLGRRELPAPQSGRDRSR